MSNYTESEKDSEHEEWYENLVKENKAKPLDKSVSVSYDFNDTRYHIRRERELLRKGYTKTYQGHTGATWELI